MANLGRLTKVDLRHVWLDEAAHFTPWLAQEDNLALLGDTIGIELELESTEKNVGPFRADILCKDTVTNDWVLIENQLEHTDHNHLGQLLTYAAGLEAVTIIWIAKRFREEHRAALDWLNSMTKDNINFFGVEIELWQIGESNVAPKFDAVSKPNNWTRQVQAARQSTELSESQQLHLQYWTQFYEFVQENSQIIRIGQVPRPKYLMDFAIGRSEFTLAVTNGMRDGYLEVQLITKGKNAVNYFYQLLQDKDAIEREIGIPLQWDVQENGRVMQKILVRREGTDTTNPDNWAEYHAWQLDMLERFYQTFRNRVMRLNADDYISPDMPDVD